MDIPNMIPAMLDELTPQQVAEMTVQELAVLQQLTKADQDTAKKRMATLNTGLGLKFDEIERNQRLADAKKDRAKDGATGAVTFTYADVPIKITRTKNVDVNQVLLVAAANSMADAELRDILIKSKHTFNESAFLNQPQHVQDLFAGVRTIKAGAATYVLTGALPDNGGA